MQSSRADPANGIAASICPMCDPLHESGFDACDRLVLSRMTPPDGADAGRQATLSYADVLKGSRFLRLQPDIGPPYRPCNPSVLRTPEGYLVNCRTVNFEQRRLRYFCDDADGVFRSRNVLMRLARDFTVLDERPMVIDEPPLRQTAIQGLEDCRLFEVEGTHFAFCATTDRHPSGHIHLSVCRLLPDGRVAAHRPLVGPFDDRPQKNWLPFVDRRGNVCAIYGYDPLTVVRVSVDSGRYDVEAEIAHPWNAASWRGSAGPISVPRSDRLLILVHEAVSRDGPDGHPERVYLHRFVECDSGFSLTRVSRPFVFAHQGVEFSCGMTLSHDRASLVVGLGIEDGSAYLCRIPLARVETLLQDMNLPG